MAPRDPLNISIGPGLLYIGLASVDEPATASETIDPADFEEVGYTEEGSTFTYERNNEDVYVAEEIDPVRNEITTSTSMLTLSLAEMTVRNLNIAFNTWAGAGTSFTGGDSFEPPEPGNDLRYMLVLDTPEDGRWIFRRCVNRGTIELARKKSPEKALIGVEWKLEKPTGLALFKVISNADGLV
jgi:hypothetical protein